MGISRYRLCREFSATFHTSPLQYLQGKKIEAAKSLLLSTDNPIHEVGAMVGIDNTNHFIHLFKKHTGVTPFVYRQNAPQSIRETHCPSVPVGLPPR
ncbi:MAG: helix-turn-helix transcriptional regulator [Waltera sp.]